MPFSFMRWTMIGLNTGRVRAATRIFTRSCARAGGPPDASASATSAVTAVSFVRVMRVSP